MQIITIWYRIARPQLSDVRRFSIHHFSCNRRSVRWSPWCDSRAMLAVYSLSIRLSKSEKDSTVDCVGTSIIFMVGSIDQMMFLIYHSWDIFQLYTQLLHFIYFIDANCIQLLAPSSHVNIDQGIFSAGEHIGHISRSFAEILAPLLDKHPLDLSLQGHLMYTDTNHTRLGFDLDIIVLSSMTEEFNKSIFLKFCEMNLNPSMI